MDLLTTVEERSVVCTQFGVDWFAVLTFDAQLSQKGFRDFYEQSFVHGTGISVVVEGYDHHWGKDRAGNIDALHALGREYDFSVVEVEPFLHNGTIVNSSSIRSLLQAGNVTDAQALLGRPYSLRGTVVVGDRRGRLLGYPTANLQPDSAKKMVPKNGIYLVEVALASERFFGMASIGVRPTFQTDGRRTIEVYVMDFDRDIYGSDMQISFLRRLRDELKFDSAEQLVRQMDRDRDISRGLVLELHHAGTIENIAQSNYKE
jgi:riboflavin kinase/FMN adenylyltransferase